VADTIEDEPHWLAVIGKALTYLCLQQARAKEPEKFESVLQQVEFLEGLGMDQDGAAVVAGSTPASVRELRRLKRNKSGKGKKYSKRK
jgi:hypothetical protein